MKGITLASAFIVAVFLLASALTPPIKADIFDDSGNRLASGPYILFPVNTTYSSRIVTLNISFSTKLFFNVPLSATYSLDGTPNVIVPLVSSPSMIWNKNRVEGSVTLPELSDGSHKLSVYVEANWGTGSSYWDSETVYFTVETTPPKIILQIENRTNSQNNLPLNITVDKQVAWMGYSLDEKANVTFIGNMTLNELAYGSHSLAVYANDTVGNMGATENVNFNIKKPEVFPVVPIAIVSIALIIVICAGLLVYHKKRKR